MYSSTSHLLQQNTRNPPHVILSALLALISSRPITTESTAALAVQVAVTAHLDKAVFWEVFALPTLCSHTLPFSSQESKPSLSVMSQCAANITVTMAYKAKQRGLCILFPLHASRFPYGSSHSDVVSFSNIAKSFPSSEPCTCVFLLTTKYQPATPHWNGALSLVKSQVSHPYRGLPNKSRARVPVTCDHFT